MPLTLGNNEVHVWRATLDQSCERVQNWAQVLSAEERARADRFAFERDRGHFVVAHWALRDILSRYADMQPTQLRFCSGAYGKPALCSGSGRDDLRFNLSHSQGLALYAITRGREIGIDVERICPELADEQVAERFFSRREIAALRSVPRNMRYEAFFNCWTRKEAYIKARGEGVSLPLDEFDVSLAPGEPAALLTTAWDPEEASRWSFRILSAGPGYAAALVVEGRHWRLQGWQWVE